MIDSERYNRLLPKGLVSVVKSELANDVYLIKFKRFSVEDGTELSPEIQSVTAAELSAERSRAEGMIKAIDSVLLS